mgnify:CR=1 FL=1|tara:strand:- start:2701 stop:3249 length:549 start_codon:yes stop_codon:yes gene_type:complete
MSDWDIYKAFEESLTQFIDEIYKKHFGDDITIDRSTREDENEKKLFMDINFSIDTIIRFPNGSVLNLQEKSRQNTWLSKNEYTIQLFKDYKNEGKGEWFKLMAQFYFYGFANKESNGYSKYYILNVGVLRLALNSIDITKYPLMNNKEPLKSNFYCIPFKTIEELDKEFNGLILYKSDDTDN